MERSRRSGRWLLLAATVGLLLATPARTALRQDSQPWDTAEGRACFEQWITDAVARLNAHDGSEEFNSRKPWSINQHGVLEGNQRFGPRSAGPPPDFARYGSNKYWWMWEHYLVDAETGWRAPDWNAAAIPPLRDTVLACLKGRGTPPPGQVTTVLVRADRAWTPSGLVLAAGQSVRIEAADLIEAAASTDERAFFHRVPPDGRPEFLAHVPQPLLPALMLLGKIGDGPALPIGKLVERLEAGTIYGSGQLLLGINDDVLEDNSGAWRVTITRID